MVEFTQSNVMTYSRTVIEKGEFVKVDFSGKFTAIFERGKTVKIHSWL
jgi:hypothetical protein